MQTKTKSKNLKNILIGVAVITTGSFLIWQKISFAQTSVTDLQQQTSKEQEETDKKIKELEKRADIYRDIIDIKKKQSATLNDQLSVTDSSISHIQAQIDVSKQKIDDFNSQILRLEKQIKEKEALMESQRKILSSMVQSYYEVNLASPVVVYLNDGNLASFIVKKDRIAQTGDRIRDMVLDVKEIKAELETQSEDLEKKKVEAVSARENLSEKSDDLESVKQQKENLLAQTKGEEARYQQLLARVEAQKQELLDIDQFFVASGLSIDSYPKPPSSLNAPLSWYYSQRDSRWGDNTIGNSKSTLKAYGCAIASVAMVFSDHGGSITPAQLAKKPIFSWDLISWPTSWSDPKLAMSSDGFGHGNINWKTIDASIVKGVPVIVYIKRSKGGGHYVVVHHKESKTGKYVVHDPYFGPNLYLDTSRALVGAMGASSATSMDQMIIYN